MNETIYLVIRDKFGRFAKGTTGRKGIKKPGFVSSTSFKKGQTPWNKGLTVSDPRVAKYINKQIDQYPVKCERCGQEFTVNKYRKDLTRFCGKNCRGKWLGEKQTGKNNPFGWKGGYENTLHLNKRLRAKKRNAEGSHTLKQWELLKEEYDYTCPACGKKEPEIKLSQDHIIPLSKDGSDYIENIQPLCRSCNSKKRDKIMKYIKWGGIKFCVPYFYAQGPEPGWEI